MAHTNFDIITDVSDKIGLWNIDAFVKKNTGRGYKRAPHIILDRGVNQGVVSRYELAKSKRNPDWSNGTVGDGLDALPAPGIRLFLHPLQQAKITSKVYWQNVGMGTNLIQPLALLLPVVRYEISAKSGIPHGLKPSMSALRSMVADAGPEMGMPHDVASVITGHGSLTVEKRDKQMRPYQEQLAMALREQLKCAFILSDAGREMEPDQHRFNWNDAVPDRLVTVLRTAIMPHRLKQFDLDCREAAADCIKELNAGGGDKENRNSKVIDMTKGRLGPSPEHSAAKRCHKPKMTKQPMMPMQQQPTMPTMPMQQQPMMPMMPMQQQPTMQMSVQMQMQQMQQQHMQQMMMMQQQQHQQMMMMQQQMQMQSMVMPMQQQQQRRQQQQTFMMQQQEGDDSDEDEEPPYLPPTQPE